MQGILKIFLIVIATSLSYISCSSRLVETVPEIITDTSAVVITANASQGNKGLLGYKGPVYVHIGLITDSSIGPTYWRYVKFKWGSTEEAALASPAGNNKWIYKIPNIRNFFAVPENERIRKLCILFREGNCIDTFCKVLRNADKSDILIPIAANN